MSYHQLHGNKEHSSRSLLHQLLILIYATSVTLSVPIDFQVGNYLHKFFKEFLPNNTNYRRRPGDEEPYKKYYSRLYSTDAASTLPSIEGLQFKMADVNLPTLPFGNLTIGTYDPWVTTPGTTPSKESVLKMGEVFKNLLMEKSGIIKNIAGAYKEFLKQSSTSNPHLHLVDVFENYDEKMARVMSRVEAKMVKKVEAYYTKIETTTSAGIIQNFVNQMKNAYREQVESLMHTTPPPTPDSAERYSAEVRNASNLFHVEKSQEARDQAGIKGLAEIDDQFVTREEFEEALKDIHTPDPSEKW